MTRRVGRSRDLESAVLETPNWDRLGTWKCLEMALIQNGGPNKYFALRGGKVQVTGRCTPEYGCTRALSKATKFAPIASEKKRTMHSFTGSIFWLSGAFEKKNRAYAALKKNGPQTHSPGQLSGCRVQPKTNFAPSHTPIHRLNFLAVGCSRKKFRACGASRIRDSRLVHSPGQFSSCRVQSKKISRLRRFKDTRLASRPFTGSVF